MLNFLDFIGYIFENSSINKALSFHIGDTMQAGQVLQTKDCIQIRCRFDGLLESIKNYNNCSSHCSYNEWSDWTLCPKCSKDSNFEFKTRTRTLISSLTSTEINCDNEITESKICELPSCSCINNYNCSCILSEWSPWSNCSKSCGLGFQSRYRYYISRGISCPYNSLIQNRDCNQQCCQGT